MSAIALIWSQDTVTFVVKGQPYQADKSHPKYQELLDELKKAEPDTDRCIALTKPIEIIREAIADAQASEPDYLPAGKISVTSREIRFDGEVVDGVLVDRILAMLAEGFDIMPMARFFENLYQNPATWVRDELYVWLERSTLPITEDGCFLAYKNVNGDFTSIYDNTTLNTPGTVVQMDRSKVNPERAMVCSSGLHFCSKDYLPGFSHGRDNTTILLKINPADVVSVPANETAKGRAWKYEVLEVVEHDPQTYEWSSVASADGGDYDMDDDDDYEDDDYYGYGDDDETDDDTDVESEDVSDFLFPDDGETSEFVDDHFVVIHICAEEDIFPEGDDDAGAKQEASEEEADANAKQGRVDAINDLGIIGLRNAASRAGFKGAWKGPKATELRAYLIERA